MRDLLILSTMLLGACGTPNDPAPVGHTTELAQCKASITPNYMEDSRDTVLFNGLACYGGDSHSCSIVKETIVTPDGPLCRRKPIGLGMDGVICPDTDPNAYSRDMLLGVMAYVLATDDVTAYNAAITWIEDNGRLSEEHAMTPSMRHLVNLVGIHVGGPQLSGASADPADVVTWASASTVTGYQAHLVAVKLELMKHMGYDGGRLSGLDEAARRLAERFPANSFFQYVAGNTAEAEFMILKQCENMPAVGEGWKWQRDALNEFSGLDMRFVIDLLLGG